MKFILSILLFVKCLPYLVLSQLHCHRCFGNSYCNNANNTEFATNIRNATCNVGTKLSQIEDPIARQIQMAINANFLSDWGDDQVSTHPFRIQADCVTATVHEPHDIHTLRTCVARAVFTGSNTTLCDMLQTLIESQNVNNGTFTCRECNGTHFCNDHTLHIDDGIVTPDQSVPSASIAISTSLGFVAAIALFYKLL